MNIFSKGFLIPLLGYKEYNEFFIEAFKNSKNKKARNFNKYARRFRHFLLLEIIKNFNSEKYKKLNVEEILDELSKNNYLNSIKSNKVSKRQYRQNLFGFFIDSEEDYKILNPNMNKSYKEFLLLVSGICEFLTTGDINEF